MAINIKKSLQRSPLRISLLAVLSAVAVSLELLRIEFPFPLAPFLKYDLVGVPLLLLAMISGNRDALLGATVTAVAVFIATGDPIGASMKWLAEVATFIPFTIIYGKNRVRASLAIVAATASEDYSNGSRKSSRYSLLVNVLCTRLLSIFRMPQDC